MKIVVSVFTMLTAYPARPGGPGKNIEICILVKEVYVTFPSVPVYGGRERHNHKAAEIVWGCVILTLLGVLVG